MIKKSFTLRVLAISFLLLALPLLVDSFIFFQHSYYNSVADAERVMRIETNFRAFNLLGILPVKPVLLRELIYTLNLDEDSFIQEEGVLNKGLAEVTHEGGPFQIFIAKIEAPAKYRIIASSAPELINTYFVSYKVMDEILKKGEGSFIRYNLSKVYNAYLPYIYMVKTIHSKKTGQLIGIIVAAADIEPQLSQLVKKNTSKNLNFAVLNGDGIVFAASDPGLKGQFFDPISTERRSQILESSQIGLKNLASAPLPIIEGKNPPFFEFVFNDIVQIAYRVEAPVGNVSILGYSPKEILFGAAVKHFLLIYMIYGLILVVGGGFAYWLALWISRPLRQLSVVMEHVEKGNLEERFKEEPFGFEINILGKLFNQTLDNLLFNMRRAEDERVKKETYQREIAFIRQVQESLLLPPQKEYDALEYSALYLPADEVVGDYYNYLAHESPSGEKTFLFSVVDASGTGLTSCLYALSARSLFSTYATLYDDIADILARANNDFAQEARDSGFFLRLFYGKYHCLTKTLHYCCCGHVSGLIKKFNGVTHELSHRGIAIGLKSDITYPVEKVALEAGDLVVVYTDGLVNARNEKGEVFTEERLKGLIKKNTWVSAQEVIDHISNELQRFKGVVPQKHATIAAVLKVQ